MNLSVSLPNPEVNYVFTEDNIPIVDPSHLYDVSTFEQLYLIGKVLGESLPLKLITFKCLAEWKLSGEVSIINMSYGFSLVKFTSVMDRK